MDNKIFNLVTLTLMVDLLLKNFNLGNSFLTRRGRAFIFHICIPCSKIFNAVPSTMNFDVVTLTLKFDLYKTIDGDYDFWIRGVIYCCYLHMVAAGELCCLSDNSGLASRDECQGSLCHSPTVRIRVWWVDKNFNLGHNFLTRNDRAFILHMCIPCYQTFHMVS